MEERPTERERQRFSERPRERRQTAGENFCERTVPEKEVGGCGVRERVWEPLWPKESLIFTLRAFSSAKRTRINSNFIHFCPVAALGSFSFPQLSSVRYFSIMGKENSGLDSR